MGFIVMAYIGMSYIVVAYLAKAYVVVAFIVMAHPTNCPCRRHGRAVELPAHSHVDDCVRKDVSLRRLVRAQQRARARRGGRRSVEMQPYTCHRPAPSYL